jgi:hypothetical protein
MFRCLAGGLSVVARTFVNYLPGSPALGLRVSATDPAPASREHEKSEIRLQINALKDKTAVVPISAVFSNFASLFVCGVLP